MKDIFTYYSTIIVFFHVLSAVIWVGGMIMMMFVIHPVLQKFPNNEFKLDKTLQIVRRLFHLVLPFIFVLLITAIFMIKGLDIAGEYPVKFKEIIWIIMFINYLYMYYKRYKSNRFFSRGDFENSKNELKNIPKIFLPLNISLGLIAIFMGVILRGI